MHCCNYRNAAIFAHDKTPKTGERLVDQEHKFDMLPLDNASELPKGLWVIPVCDQPRIESVTISDKPLPDLAGFVERAEYGSVPLNI